MWTDKGASQVHPTNVWHGSWPPPPHTHATTRCLVTLVSHSYKSSNFIYDKEVSFTRSGLGFESDNFGNCFDFGWFVHWLGPMVPNWLYDTDYRGDDDSNPLWAKQTSIMVGFNLTARLESTSIWLLPRPDKGGLGVSFRVRMMIKMD